VKLWTLGYIYFWLFCQRTSWIKHGRPSCENYPISPLWSNTTEHLNRTPAIIRLYSVHGIELPFLLIVGIAILYDLWIVYVTRAYLLKVMILHFRW
jgi:hypothetical protein